MPNPNKIIVNESSLQLSDNFKPHHLKRLIKLRDVMQSAKKVKGGYVLELAKDKILFDIDVFALPAHHSDYEEVMAKTSCGTAACVIGTAGMIPEFRKAGLKTDSGANDVFLFNSKKKIKAREYEAFGEFFGTTTDYTEGYRTDTSTYMCDPFSYKNTHLRTVTPTPKDVVKRLNVLIKKGEKFLASKAK